MAKTAVSFGITRGGSSISTRLLQVLAKGSGWALNDIGGQAYRDGVPLHDIPEESFASINRENTLVGPFREIPQNAGPLLDASTRKIFVFRDPRDCLVSQYYAQKNIHSVFTAGQVTDQTVRGTEITQSIDEYVRLHAQDFVQTYVNYIAASQSDSQARFFRYEDLSFNPTGWLSEVVDFLDMSPGTDAMNQAVVEAYFWRIGSDAFSHNRQGQAGDFVHELSEDTISFLNESFQSTLDYLGYEAHPQPTMKRFADALSSAEEAAEIIYAQRIQIDEMKRAIHNLMRANGRNASRIDQLEQVLKSQQVQG